MSTCSMRTVSLTEARRETQVRCVVTWLLLLLALGNSKRTKAYQNSGSSLS